MLRMIGLVAVIALWYFYFVENPQRIKKLEEEVEASKINNEIVIEVNKENRDIKELQDEEEEIYIDDVNYSDVLGGMFIFKPLRQD